MGYICIVRHTHSFSVNPLGRAGSGRGQPTKIPGPIAGELILRPV